MNVVITGSGRGIGMELVKLFAKNGDNVLAISRNIDPLQSIVEENENVFAISFDIYKGVYSELIEFITSSFEEVDILINNAGQIINKPFGEISGDDLQRSYGTNVFGPIYMIQNLQRFFSKRAHIINIGSMGGFQGSQKFAGLAAYSSAKAALSCLTECLQEEYSSRDWSFNCLCLGAVQTEMLEEAFPGYEAPHNSLEMASYIYRFAKEDGKFFKGKILPVSISTP